MAVFVSAALWAGVAWSADAQPSLLLPGAAPLHRKQGETSWGVTAAWSDIEDLSFLEIGPSAQGVLAASDRIALFGTLVLSPITPGALGLVGARYVVWERPGLTVAPMGGVFWRVEAEPWSLWAINALGVAVEGGWERVRLDVSLPLAGARVATNTWPVESRGLPGPLLLSFVEAGVTVKLDDHSSIRLGALSLLPTAVYRYEGSRWIAEASVSTLGRASVVSARFGVGAF